MKRPPLVADIRPRAREDVDAIAATIASEHPKAALRFLDAFDAAIDRLLQFPELAQVWPTNRPETFSTVRRLVLRGFRVSIFYRPTVIDVGHAALVRKLRGHCASYGITGNEHRLSAVERRFAG